jgi:hypothetical protein
MKKLILWAVGTVLLLGFGWGAYAAYRAQGKLVTLNVRNADVRAVVRSVEWQTWETIIVHRSVSGRVTLNVSRMPLERVLAIMSEQLSGRWQAVYPLYSSRESRLALEKVVLGEAKAGDTGWSAYETRPFRGDGGVFGANLRAENTLVTIKVPGKDVSVAALGLDRFAQAQVVPEDGTKGTVYLQVAQVTMPEAVSKLARQVKRNWTRLYTLQPGFRYDTVRRDAPSTTAVTGSGQPPAPLVEPVERTEKDFEAQLETMTPEEQKQALEARRRWQELRNLSPEERRKRFQEMMSNPQVQQQMQARMLQRLRDSTPEERAERYQRLAARRAAGAAGVAR